MKKSDWPFWLPDIANYTAADWFGWFAIVFAIGAVCIGAMALCV